MSTDKKSCFVDAKRVIGNRKSKTGRQYNGQSKKEKMINSGLEKIHRKLKIEQHESHLKSERNSVGDNTTIGGSLTPIYMIITSI
jgi:hypothetical protein